MEVALYAILLFPLLLVVFDSLCRLLFLVVIQLPKARDERQADAGHALRLLVLVLAHNEQATIERTLGLIQAQTDEDALSRVVVLADHCSDETASIAMRKGVGLYVREEGCPGKSQALSWLVHQQPDLLSTADIVTVLDADTLVDGGFCRALRAAFGPGVDAVQSFVNPVSDNGFPLTTLVSFSEILSGKIDDKARSRLGWSVPLRGTGMAFRRAAFVEACQQLGTQVDDIELSVRLAEQGIRVHLDLQAVVNDPKPDRVLGLARQRGRWLKGQRQVWKIKQRNIRKLLRSGLPNWSLIQAMLLKPKTALVSMRLALLALLWIWPFPNTVLHNIIFAAVVAGFLIDVIYYLSGLRFVDKPGHYLVSLLTSPILLILWVISWGYSLLPTQEWLRAHEK